MNFRVAEADFQMKELLALSCGLISLHKVRMLGLGDRLVYSEMKETDGEMTLGRSGNHW